MSATTETAPSVATLRRPTPPKSELKAIGRSVAKTQGVSVEAYFRAHLPAIEAVIPRQITPERLLKIALGAIRETPKLGECTVASLFGAVMQCAAMGLEPNTYQGHVYLIPRKNNVPVKDEHGRIVKDASGKWVTRETWEVQVQLGYKGRIELAYRNPKITLIKAVVVYENDDFQALEGTDQIIHHTYDLAKPRGRVIGFYAVALLSTGKALFDVMSKADVEAIRDEHSDSYSSAVTKLANARTDRERKRASDTPWISDFLEMGRKTVLHRICKYLPSTPEMEIAASLDDRAAAGASQHLGADIEGDPVVEDEEQEAQEEQSGDPAPTQGAGAPALTHETKVTLDLGGRANDAAPADLKAPPSEAADSDSTAEKGGPKASRTAAAPAKTAQPQFSLGADADWGHIE